MNMKLPMVVTAAAVAAMMGAHAQAAPVGAAMNFTNNILITGIVAGTGSATGTGAFDSSGTLTITSATQTIIPAFAAVATVTATTVYGGSITGTTWNSNLTSTATVTACTGAALVCGNFTNLPSTTTPAVAFFSVDINTGGSWTSTVPNGPVTLNNSNTLAPVPVPAAAWLFGSALVGLVGIGRKRKAA